MLALTLAAGLRLARTGRGGTPFALLSGLSLPLGIAALISFISIWFYELPTHHCPFCLLQADYGHVGYALYVGLLGGTVTGVGSGLLGAFEGRASLAAALPAVRRRLAAAACVCYGLFGALAAGRMIFSAFRP